MNDKLHENDKLRLVYSSTASPAHKALAAHINGKIVVPRPFNVGSSDEWTTEQQVSWAILQVKHALANHRQSNSRDLQFAPNDKIAKSPDKDIIRLSARDLSDLDVLKKPDLFKLAVKAFAEVAGINPEDVTTCSVSASKISWGNAMNIADPPVFVATQEREVTERLVDFALSRVLKNFSPLVFEPAK